MEISESPGIRRNRHGDTSPLCKAAARSSGSVRFGSFFNRLTGRNRLKLWMIEWSFSPSGIRPLTVRLVFLRPSVQAGTRGGLILANGTALKGRKDILYDPFDWKHGNEHDQFDP